MLSQLIFVFAAALGAIVDFEKAGAKPEDASLSTCWANTQVFNTTLARLQPGDTLLFPNKTFHLMGGIYGRGLSHVTFQFDGTLKFSDDEKAWPRDAKGNVFECIYLDEISNIVFTSTHKGVIDGSGGKWWGAVKYIEIQENRPRLFVIHNSHDILFEKILLKNSPYWTFLANDVVNLEIRYADIDARRTNADEHDWYDLTAFNTDGFDVSGANVWIHDCTIWNDDDCVCVKERPNGKCSENMLFERIKASGVGLTVGSIGPSAAHTCVRNITFRDSTMHRSFKGLYLKSRPGNASHTGSVVDVLYQNITIDRPTQWAIWLGPQQASYSGACSLLWPTLPGSKCPVPAQITWQNIVFRDIYIISPEMSPGVIAGNSTNPMKGVIFDNVVVTNPGTKPWGDKYYFCDAVEGIAQGATSPIPPCFSKQEITP